MNRVLLGINYISRHQHLALAVFIVLLSAFNSASASPINNEVQTETGNPSTKFNTTKLSSLLKNQLVPASPGLVNCRVEKCLALTFDDGPDNETTPKVLDVLKQRAAPATFFVLGSKVGGHSELVRRISAEGHEIGNHSWSHHSFTKMRSEQMRGEYDQTNAALQVAGVAPPRIFRPPYGAINSRVLATLPVPIILWNTDPQDWASDMHVKKEVDSVVGAAIPGGIVVLHDTKKGTADALPEMIKQLRASGYKLVTISQLLELNGNSQGVYYGR